LASPQKFDEAIEFGFPSSTDEEAVSKPDTTYSQVTDIVLDEKRSLSEKASMITDESSSYSLDQTVQYNASDSVHPSQHRPSVSALTKPRHLSVLPIDLAGNREMTLRMTLTRADLRADENELYGWQKPNTPPVKEYPVAVDDVTNLPDPMDIITHTQKKSNSFVKLWRKVRNGPKR